jgi:hypothetical protein
LMICAVFRTLKAADILFRACCLWSRRVNSLSQFVSAILEKGGRKRVVQSGDGQSRAFVVCMFMPRLGLFGCRRPSHTLESLISLCFKRACCQLLATSLRHINPGDCSGRPLQLGQSPLLLHVGDRHPAATILRRFRVAHAAPPHTALPSPVHRPLQNQALSNLKHLDISQPWTIHQTVFSVMPHQCQMIALLVMSTNNNRSVTSCESLCT